MEYINFAFSNWLYILLSVIVALFSLKQMIGCHIKWHSWKLVSERDWDGINIQEYECRKCKAAHRRETL